MNVERIWIGGFLFSLWVSFGFIIPIVLLITVGNLLSIIVSIILMLFSHFMIYAFARRMTCEFM